MTVKLFLNSICTTGTLDNFEFFINKLKTKYLSIHKKNISDHCSVIGSPLNSDCKNVHRYNEVVKVIKTDWCTIHKRFKRQTRMVWCPLLSWLT